jgi:F-type H+-transporting ATPase subunit b
MGELIRQFGIEWKLLAAQVVNFFILLYLLKRFAYKPVIEMLAERRRKIEEGMRASEQSVKKLSEAEAIKQHIILQAEQESVGIVSKAENTAGEQAKAIVASAHEKSEQVIAGGTRN